MDEDLIDFIAELTGEELSPWQTDMMQSVLDPDWRPPTLDEQMMAQRAAARRERDRVTMMFAALTGATVVCP